MDYFSKYVRIYPMKDQKATAVSNHLMDWVYDMGVPERLHSDLRTPADAAGDGACPVASVNTRLKAYNNRYDGDVETLVTQATSVTLSQFYLSRRLQRYPITQS